jgi:hypothetical protein
MLGGSIASGDIAEDRQRLVQPHTAWNTLAAGLRVCELDEIAGNIDHAVVFVEHHHAAGAHDGTDLRQGFIIDGRVKHFNGNASA